MAADQSCTEIKVPIPIPEEEDDHQRVHLIQRAQWLRAAILGANDGLLSTTSLMLGVGATKDDKWSMIISGLAGAIAGACSMAVGEFVSVSTQRDIEKKTLHSEARSVSTPTSDHADKHFGTYPNENMDIIFGTKGVINCSPANSQHQSAPRSPYMKVIARDKNHLHHDEETLPNPCKAAGASASAFLCGSLFPLLSAMAVSDNHSLRVLAMVIVSSVALFVFGGVGAYLGGSSIRVSAMRVLLGGWVSMAITYGLLKPIDRDHKGKEDQD